ncbi:MAG: hypothetical protein ACTHLE_26770 [Agriterribacter sp.]
MRQKLEQIIGKIRAVEGIPGKAEVTKEQEVVMILEAKVKCKSKRMIRPKPEERGSRRLLMKERKNLNFNLMNKFNSMLEKYRDTVAIDSTKARAYIKKLDYRNNFYLLKCIAQTFLDESRFEEGSNKMRVKINFRKWRMAEKYIIAAFSINPNNAEVLYTMGEVRKLNFQDDIAIYCFERIVKYGVNEIAHQEYSRGKDFAKELINDARFELYRLYYHKEPELSKNYLKKYKSVLMKGVGTIFKPLQKYLLS